MADALITSGDHYSMLLSPQQLTPTTEHAYMTHLRQVNLASLHLHPRCLPLPRMNIQSGGEGRLQGNGYEFHRVHSLHRKGTACLVDQGLPCLTTVLSVKAWYPPNGMSLYSAATCFFMGHIWG